MTTVKMENKCEYIRPPEKFDVEESKEKEDNRDRTPLSDNWELFSSKQYWVDTSIGCAAEVLTMAFYAFVGILATQTGDAFSVGFAAGGTVFVNITTFINISGAFFNPAVVIGFFFVGELSFVKTILYTGANALGAVIGAFAARGVLSNSLPGSNITQFERINGGAHFLHGGITPEVAVAAEACYTFIMMVVVFSACVDSKTKSPFGVLATGFIVVIGVLAGFNNSSGSFNPGRSFGAAVAISYYRPDVWPHHWVYWVGPMLGSIIAAFQYRILFADEAHSIKKQVLKLV